MFRKLIGDERAAISIIGALSLAAVVGVSALAVEFGHGLLQRSENQRVADLAAYGGALVYNSTGSSADAESAASNIAALNGVAAADVSSAVANSPTGDGNQALRVTVTTALPLYLARVLTTKASLSIGATASAEMKAEAPGCIIALAGGGTGISLSGGTQVSADNCAVASNNAVTLVGGTKITTKTVDYGTTHSISGGSSIVTPSGGAPTYSKVTTADPLAGNSAVSTAAGRISTVANFNSPSPPTVNVPSSTVTTAFSTSGVTNLPSGCSDTYNSTSKIYTVSCSGTVNFGPITVRSVTVTLNTSSGNTYNFSNSPPWPSGFTLAGSGGTYGFASGLAPSGTNTYPAGTYNINGSISTGGGATTTFGAGIYNVKVGITTGGGSNTSFGAGTFNLGSGSCSGTSGGYSICNTGTSLSFAGPSTFVLVGGIYNGGGATLTLGSSSSSNSYQIGKGGDTYSINVGTSKSMIFGDATGSGDLFQTAGSIVSGGGSCLALPAASEHDINGNIDASGGVVLGAGIYTLDGYVAFGKSSGGDVSNCPTSGTTTGVTALDVTLVVSGTNSVTCNGVAGTAFCLGAGYNTVKLTAPSSGPTAELAVIGPQSSSYSEGAAFTTGATNTQVSGAFYFPHGPVTMSGAAALHDTVDTGACLQLVGSEVTLSGGSAAASTCAGLGGGGSGSTVALVQ